MKEFFKHLPWFWILTEFGVYFWATFEVLGNPDWGTKLLPSFGIYRYLIFPTIILLITISCRLIWKQLLANRVKIDKDRKRHDENLLSLVKQAKERIWSVSIAGRSLAKLEKGEKTFIDLIDKGVFIRILTLDPNHVFVAYQEESEDDKETGRIKQRIKDSLSFWDRLYQKIDTRLKGNLNLKIHRNGGLNQSILIVDDHMFIVPYLYNSLGEHSPVIYIDKKYHPEIFDKFLTVFSKLWGDGNSIDNTMLHPTNNKPKFGQ